MFSVCSLLTCESGFDQLVFKVCAGVQRFLCVRVQGCVCVSNGVCVQGCVCPRVCVSVQRRVCSRVFKRARVSVQVCVCVCLSLCVCV